MSVVNSCEKNILNYSCPIDYYRLSENSSCKPCLNGFNTYKNYSFNCYKTDISDKRNFTSAKLFCKNNNSTLWAPKTLTEQKIIFDGKRFWVDSKINYVGEPFIWPDGSRIYGLKPDEPNNDEGNNTYLNEDVLFYNHYLFHDVSSTNIEKIICQQEKLEN